MTRIRPFRALRYDPEHVDLSQVIAPPYDVIAAEERGVLFDREPHNAVRLELTRSVEEQAATDYAEVPERLAAWRREGVLALDASQALYPLRQRFTAPDGRVQTRDGFFALLHLEDYDRGVVRRHELTLRGPKADRLKLLRASRANLSPVFLLYEDRAGELDGALAPCFDGAPLTEARDDAGTLHRLSALTDRDRIEAVCAFLAERPLVIADGHHRYETALQYRNEARGRSPDAGPAEWLLVYLANAYAEGSLLLPIHRLVRKGGVPADPTWAERLPGWGCRSVPVASAEEIPELLQAHLAPLADRHAFAADDASGTLRVFSREPRPEDGGELTIRVLHREVIGGVFGLDDAAVEQGAIDYPKSALQTARDLRAGRGSVALYLNPLRPDDVFRATAEGEVLPQKSTFFYPKLPTGLVFRVFD